MKITYNSFNECSVIHDKSLDVINVQTPKEFGGKGETYTSTDLLATALATCIATSIAPILERNGINLKDAQFHASKQLSVNPKALQSILISIYINDMLSDLKLKKIRACIKQCLAYKLLKSQLIINIKIKTSLITP